MKKQQSQMDIEVYNKMVRVGIAREAVMQKMRIDDHANLIAQLIE